MKKEKKKSILAHLILLVILAAPFLLTLNGRQKFVWYEWFLYPLIAVIACYVVAILGGIVLSLAIYGSGSLYASYTYLIKLDAEHAMEFEKGWKLEAVMSMCYPASAALLFVVLYVLSLIGL